MALRDQIWLYDSITVDTQAVFKNEYFCEDCQENGQHFSGLLTIGKKIERALACRKVNFEGKWLQINWMLKFYCSRKPEKETTRWFWWIWWWWIYSFNFISSTACATPAGIYTTNGTAGVTSCAWCTRNTSR